jgi:hypothetical protein
LIAVAVNLVLDCPACDEEVALRALSSPVPCSACHQSFTIGLEQWRELLDAAVHDGPKLPPGRSEPNDRTDDFGPFARREPRCRGCENLLPIDALLAAAGSVRCASCGASCSARPVPPEILPVMANVKRVVSEDLSGASNPIDSHVFYLLCDEAVRPAPGGRAMIPWESFEDCIADAAGNLYLIASDGRESSSLTVFSLDPKQRTRWIRKDLKLDSYSRLVVTQDGTLLVWNPRRHSFVKLATADGSDLGKLGGAQPPDATIHHLDLKDAEHVTSDPTDGTLLVLNKERLLRYAADGTGIATWPMRTGFLGRKIVEKLRPLGTPLPEEARSIEHLHHRPLAIWSARIHIGFDGCTYLLSGDWLARLDRTGKRVYHVQLPRRQERLGADAAGNAYTLGYIEDGTSAILRITPEGTVALHVDGRAAATPLLDEDRLAVLPDGSAICASGGGSLRMFAPDGTQRSRTPGAIKADAERARERAERIANDEE